jgi:hypothetical protein
MEQDVVDTMYEKHKKQMENKQCKATPKSQQLH